MHKVLLGQPCKERQILPIRMAPAGKNDGPGQPYWGNILRSSPPGYGGWVMNPGKWPWMPGKGFYLATY
jgi:hypothetical protein